METLTAPPGQPGGIDLLDPVAHAATDLSPLWRWLRQEEPVYWYPPAADRPGFWVLSRHADIVAVYRDSKRFKSGRGNALDTLLRGGDPAGGQMAAVSDAPRHTGLRRLLLRSFTPRVLSVITDRLVAVTRELFTEAVRRGEFDFAADVAAQIPLATICDLLDIPGPDRARILELTKSVLSSEHADATSVDTWLAKNDLLFYFARLARQRRDTPHADVISQLATGQVDDRLLSDDEIVLNCYGVILGGDETTRLSMVGGVLALVEHPGQWAALRDGLVPVASAVEEVLRWTSASMHLGRVAAEDVELHGKLIRAGDVVTLWNVSANRDERAFDQPDRFDLARSPNNHLAFGHGPHFCLGASLGRLEIGTMLQVLRSTVREMRLCGPVTPIYSNFLTGLSSLPLGVVAADSP